jgi:hypothetical protein
MPISRSMLRWTASGRAIGSSFTEICSASRVEDPISDELRDTFKQSFGCNGSAR